MNKQDDYKAGNLDNFQDDGDFGRKKEVVKKLWGLIISSILDLYSLRFLIQGQKRHVKPRDADG